MQKSPIKETIFGKKPPHSRDLKTKLRMRRSILQHTHTHTHTRTHTHTYTHKHMYKSHHHKRICRIWEITVLATRASLGCTHFIHCTHTLGHCHEYTQNWRTTTNTEKKIFLTNVCVFVCVCVCLCDVSVRVIYVCEGACACVYTHIRVYTVCEKKTGAVFVVVRIRRCTSFWSVRHLWVRNTSFLSQKCVIFESKIRHFWVKHTSFLTMLYPLLSPRSLKCLQSLLFRISKEGTKNTLRHFWVKKCIRDGDLKHTHLYTQKWLAKETYIYTKVTLYTKVTWYTKVTYVQQCVPMYMGWLRLVGSIQL